MDFATLDVTMKVTNSWDSETKSNFKALVVSSKRISFVELMDWEAYKFGLLLTESNDGKVVSINEILLEMNKAIVCGRSAQGNGYYFQFKMMNFVKFRFTLMYFVNSVVNIPKLKCYFIVEEEVATEISLGLHKL